jgi:DNA-binding MarR family transcriptional regulator
MRIMVNSRPSAAAARKKDDDAPRGMGQVLEFMRLLWAVDHGLQSTSKHMESSFGITGPQRLTVRIVGRFPGISAGELATILLVHPSTLTGVLKRLTDRGIIRRRTDPEDARRAVLYLTAKGKKLDDVRSGTVESSVRQTLSLLPQAKVDAAAEVLRQLAEQLTRE